MLQPIGSEQAFGDANNPLLYACFVAEAAIEHNSVRYDVALDGEYELVVLDGDGFVAELGGFDFESH